MPAVTILYHYFYPDDVVSSLHFTELAEGLASRGWEVTAVPSNRSCRDSSVRFSRKGTVGAVQIRRIWRPSFSSASGWGRLVNAIWMLSAWSLYSLLNRPDVLIIGTDPVLSAMTALPWKAVRKRTRIAHWCFDVYPEAAEAEGILKPGMLLKTIQRLISSAYRRMDTIVDLGDCMRERLRAYPTPARKATLPPWALSEPPEPLSVDMAQRAALFGDAKLVLLYSGNFGRSHSYKEIFQIARSMRGLSVHFAFSIRGNCAQAVRDAITPEDTNISLLPFATQEQLEPRLALADIHIVSLRSEWTGTVVPSKFFGAIAVGRPVLFIGSEQSYIARTIVKYGLGWVCSQGGETRIANELAHLAGKPMDELRAHCHRVYQTFFCRRAILDAFDVELRTTLGLATAEAASRQERKATATA